MDKRTRRFLSRFGVGGVFYHAWNVVSTSQVRRLNQALRAESAEPILIAVDQEPGEIARLKGVLPDQPTPSVIGADMRPRDSRAMGRTTGQALCDLGFNLNFAPVADVVFADDSFMASRSYGSDPSLVSRHVSAYLRGVQASGVAGTLKHFPGHGGVTEDSHEELPVDDRPLSGIRRVDLVPFEAGIEAGARAVMTSHVLYPSLDVSKPASLSPKITTGLLRRDLGFDGLVIADALEMGAITDRWSVPRAAVEAIKAGVDMILIWKDLGLVRPVLSKLRAAVESGKLPRHRVEEAQDHVREAVEWAAQHGCGASR